MHRTVLFALAALHAGVAVAQVARQDPNDPKVKVPPAEYRAVFDDYRPFAEQEPGDWRKANEEVGAAGGHAGHAKQGQKAPAKPAGANSAPTGHEGHK